MIADLEAFGAPADVIAQATQESGADCEVWPENWPVVELWLRIETQWRVGFNGLIGLDYGAVRWMFDLYEVDDRRGMLEALQVMERAVLEAKGSGDGD